MFNIEPTIEVPLLRLPDEHDAAQQFFHAAIRCRDGETWHLFAYY